MHKPHKAYLMQKLSSAPLDVVMDLLVDAVCVVDPQGVFLFVSAAGERIFGYKPDEMIGRPMLDFVFIEDQERTLRVVDEIVSGAAQPHFENRYVRKDGRLVHIMWSARWSALHQVRVAVARDVSQRKRAESMQAALLAISEAAYAAEDMLDLFRRIRRIIGGLQVASDFSVALYDEALGQLTFPYDVDVRSGLSWPQNPHATLLSQEVIRTGEAMFLAAHGTLKPWRLYADQGRPTVDFLGVPLKAKRGVIGALVIQAGAAECLYIEHDVELLQFVSAQIAFAIERKQMELRLQHVARHDPLTDLPNRDLFHDRLREALSRAEHDHTRLSLLYLDLDQFKQVNDTLGHAVGDSLLQITADRLASCVQAEDTVCRIGGDEFLVLLNSISIPEEAVSVAEIIRTALGAVCELAGHRLQVSPSIGIAIYPDHSEDYRQLILYADEAMYEAKKSGGNRFRMKSL